MHWERHRTRIRGGNEKVDWTKRVTAQHDAGGHEHDHTHRAVLSLSLTWSKESRMCRTIYLAVAILALNGCMGLHSGMGHGDDRESSSSSHQH